MIELPVVLLVIIGIFLLIPIIFIVTHLRPLTEEEVMSLAVKRRRRSIRAYFLFDNQEYTVDKEFKKRMNPKGAFYKINEDLFEFPAIAAALLKYKKHEWIIIAFEKDKKVNLIWVNKGVDRSCVSSYLSVWEITEIAKRGNFTSVLKFHNHPNPDPNYYSCEAPSDKDIKSARELARVLNANGINLLEFICERGKHYKYLLSPSDAFLPLTEFLKAIEKANGRSRLGNLALHLERIF